MSAMHVVEITCDALECGNQNIDEGPAAWVRELSADKGWTTTGRRDYCPAHSPKTSPEKDA